MSFLEWSLLLCTLRVLLKQAAETPVKSAWCRYCVMMRAVYFAITRPSSLKHLASSLQVEFLSLFTEERIAWTLRAAEGQQAPFTCEGIIKLFAECCMLAYCSSPISSPCSALGKRATEPCWGLVNIKEQWYKAGRQPGWLANLIVLAARAGIVATNLQQSPISGCWQSIMPTPACTN